MKIYFNDTNHCREAKYLFNRVYTYLKINKHIIIDDIKSADYIIINSCSSSPLIEKNNLKLIKKNKLKQIIIIGCTANWGMDNIFNNILSIPIGKEIILDSLFYRTKSILNVNSININKNNYKYNNPYIVQISRGCNYNCSYCFIKKGIGHYEHVFFQNKELNIKKLKYILFLVRKYPTKIKIEKRFSKLI